MFKDFPTDYQKFLTELKQLISATKSDYELLYKTVLQKVFDYIQQLPTNTKLVVTQNQDLFDLACTRILVTLKHRRAYMLPIGANAETCYKQQDAWTYAFFTAALFNDLTKFSDDSLEYVGRFMPKIGISWLKQYENLFNAWHDFLNSRTTSSNIIAQLIEKAGAALLNNHSNDIKSQVYNDSLLNNQSFVDSFLTWLKHVIEQKILTINKIDSLIQHVKEGILLVMPEVYEKFLSEILKTNNIQKSTLNLASLISQLTERNLLLKNESSGNFTHRYYRGDWEARDLTEGFLIHSSQLFDENSMPHINDLLKIDPT